MAEKPNVSVGRWVACRPGVPEWMAPETDRLLCWIHEFRPDLAQRLRGMGKQEGLDLLGQESGVFAHLNDLQSETAPRILAGLQRRHIT